jgi:2-methylcitrate dehydratase PrpD
MAVLENIVEHLVKIRFEDIPKRTVEKQKDLLIDTLGVAIAGSKAPGVAQILDLLKEIGGREESSVLSGGGKSPAFLAAMANSLMAHAVDFDDMHEKAGIHANVCVIPAALAMAERVGGVSGKTFLTAVILGNDLICRMGLSIPLMRGWHATTTFGIFGATIASSKILGLDERKMANALGIAYSQASGNRQGRLEGTLAKRLQVAMSVKSGVLSSLFAHRGLTGPRKILEGDWGMLRLYGDPRFAGDQERILEALTKDLGKTFSGDELSIKPYPSCKATHTPIYAVLHLMKEERIAAEQIEEVEVFVSKGCYQTAGRPFEIRTDPQVDAQFSIPYTVATAILTGRVGLQDFTETAIKDPRRIALAKKVTVSIDPTLLEPSTNVVNLESRILMKGQGKSHSSKASVSTGHPECPMSKEEIFAKFENCLRFGRDSLSRQKIRQAFDVMKDVEVLEDVSVLPALLS